MDITENLTPLEKAKLWLGEGFDEETRRAVEMLISSQSADLDDSFYRALEFGTGGMRGIMGVGTNRLNKYTLGQATQGLANYLHQQFSGQQIKVAIAYDVRNNSKEFGKLCADVLTANGIKVLLFKEHRPTPELSFTVRDKKCNQESCLQRRTIRLSIMVTKYIGMTVPRSCRQMMKRSSKKCIH